MSNRCPLCPVCPCLVCHADRTRTAHAYCDRIARGDLQARAVVVERSQPAQPKPEPAEAPQPKPGGCGCGGHA